MMFRWRISLSFFESAERMESILSDRTINKKDKETIMPKTLTSRERVRIALNHQEPDRVPIDITYTKKPYIKVRKA